MLHSGKTATKKFLYILFTVPGTWAYVIFITGTCRISLAVSLRGETSSVLYSRRLTIGLLSYILCYLINIIGFNICFFTKGVFSKNKVLIKLSRREHSFFW